MDNPLLSFPVLQQDDAPGRYAVWYRQVPDFRPPVSPARLQDFVRIGEVRADGPEGVFSLMQGECWSPRGEAQTLIQGLGLSHTSMSVGDLVHDLGAGTWHGVDAFGFLVVEVEP